MLALALAILGLLAWALMRVDSGGPHAAVDRLAGQEFEDFGRSGVKKH